MPKKLKKKRKNWRFDPDYKPQNHKPSFNYDGTSRKFKAKYYGECHNCNKTIIIGDWARYENRNLVHADCYAVAALKELDSLPKPKIERLPPKDLTLEDWEMEQNILDWKLKSYR